MKLEDVISMSYPSNLIAELQKGTEKKLTAQSMLDVLYAMSFSDRRLLRSRYRDELSFEKIAALENCSVFLVKKRLRRVIKSARINMDLVRSRSPLDVAAEEIATIYYQLCRAEIGGDELKRHYRYLGNIVGSCTRSPREDLEFALHYHMLRQYEITEVLHLIDPYLIDC